MTTEEKIFDKLDDIADRLARFETKHDLLSVSVVSISSDVKTLSTDGCAKGREHTRRLDVLEGRPERTLSVIAVVVSILSGVAVVVAWFTGGKTP